jgi:hypothetical protein
VLFKAVRAEARSLATSRRRSSQQAYSIFDSVPPSPDHSQGLPAVVAEARQSSRDVNKAYLEKALTHRELSRRMSKSGKKPNEVITDKRVLQDDTRTVKFTTLSVPCGRPVGIPERILSYAGVFNLTAAAPVPNPPSGGGSGQY